MISVRRFSQGDIEFAVKSCQTIGWGYLPSDFGRYLKSEPDGSFIAEADGKPVGHVFSIGYGGAGWIGMLVVQPEFRGVGIGATLTKIAIDHLRSTDAETIWLESVPKAITLYRRLGFKDAFDCLRLRRPPSIRSKTTPRNEIDKMRAREIDEIASFDAPYYGANRAKTIRLLYEEHPHLCFVKREGTRLLGYVMCRRTENGYRIGPCACNPDRPEAGEELLAHCVTTLGDSTEISIGTPSPCTDGLLILKELGFESRSVALRMYLGEHKFQGEPRGIFAIGGPEKG
jgi:GNAT superfamily N-acetyltransferase